MPETAQLLTSIVRILPGSNGGLERPLKVERRPGEKSNEEEEANGGLERPLKV